MRWRRLPATTSLVALLFTARIVAAQDTKECAAAFDAAQDSRDGGKYRLARTQFLVCARDACPAEIRRDCVQSLNDVEQSAPTLVISAKDASGNDLLSVRVRIDGEPLLDKLDGRPTLVDSGQHTFRFEAEGQPTVEERLFIRAGEKNRVVSVQLGQPAPSVAPPEPKATPSGPPVLGWVFAGVALAAFGSEAYFGLTGIHEQSDLKNSPCGPTHTCDTGPLVTRYTLADVSLGVGIVATGLSLYAFLTHRSRPAPDRTSVLYVTGQPLAGGAMGGLGGRF